MFTTAASRLSVSDLPQFLLICCKLLQTKTTLPLPLRSLPPIHHASNPKVFFTSLSSLPHSLSQHPLLCRPHTWRAESRPIWHTQITTKKRKEKKKKLLFSGLEDSSVFLSGGSNQISFPFTRNQKEWWCLLTFSQISPDKNEGERLAFLLDTQAPLNRNMKLIFNHAFFQHQPSTG